MWHSQLDHMLISLDLLNFKLTSVALFLCWTFLFFSSKELVRNSRTEDLVSVYFWGLKHLLLSSHPPQIHSQTGPVSTELFLLRGQKWLLLHAWKSTVARLKHWLFKTNKPIEKHMVNIELFCTLNHDTMSFCEEICLVLKKCFLLLLLMLRTVVLLNTYLETIMHFLGYFNE